MQNSFQSQALRPFLIRALIWRRQETDWAASK